MSAASRDGEHQSLADLSAREIAALTEYIYVYPDLGRAEGADDLYVVYSEAGREYLVDTREGACECDDQFYRGGGPDGYCKHLHRVSFATGDRSIPPWVDTRHVDPWLLEQATLATDGGDDDV